MTGCDLRLSSGLLEGGEQGSKMGHHNGTIVGGEGKPGQAPREAQLIHRG